MKPVTIKQIDELLPQTQCGLCGYKGCRPYAEAIARGEASINLCPPGGVDTLQALAALTDVNPETMLEEMYAQQKPTQKVVIQEATCIGCTKCIQACPVDAIIGAAKQMHFVITDACNGCELCIEPCPVDCIDIQILPTLSTAEKTKQQVSNRQRFMARQSRLERWQSEKKQQYQTIKLEETSRQQTVASRKEAILAAIERVKKKPHDETTT
ncbi:MAG: hypothetical protein A3F17_07125 [Gammaproteobacteria bacterium RIFCSPHIGHO2_12_FULL_41_15]|nr:MAG: hypothetical protein A3F17_07125 [Gammaproteobacteria bacterium RIFCSPHIGHO2_12_FULL_41_15]